MSACARRETRFASSWVKAMPDRSERCLEGCLSDMSLRRLRNSIWICTLFATAVAYIGARGLTEAFLYSKEAPNIFRLDVRLCP